MSSLQPQLFPGFRFYPNDQELVCQYLFHKISGTKCRQLGLGCPITDLDDIYRFEPSELPAVYQMQSADDEWFFFSKSSAKKYPNGDRKNRATEGGFWKTTGRDRPVRSRGVTVGMKKTLVFYFGRAPGAERSGWIMHEYRLLNPPENAKDSFVLCRIFAKEKTDEACSSAYFTKDIESTADQEKVKNMLPSEDIKQEQEKSAINSFVAVNDNFNSVDGYDDFIRVEDAFDDYLVSFFNDFVNGQENVQNANNSSLAEVSDVVIDPIVEHFPAGWHQQNMPSTNGQETTEDFNIEDFLLPDIFTGDFIEMNDVLSLLE